MTISKRARMWLYAILTALGVGAGTASQLLGCDSFLDDNPQSPTYGECISLEGP